ncbi:stabilin 1 [Saguinus oedipus]|uniref:Stabilin 1 n=1 Tax=Saguinus oedipus TaxID=9490 RepID=A0ABQ9U2G0_SAGOE|nr:stabilin 1 [Saguinus oedipus]
MASWTCCLFQKQGCCKGFFGPDCTQCPGGFSSPCYGKGNCSDGIQGNGACLCFPDYKGIACHICSNPNKHGEQCQEDCGCVHGLCDNRPGSGGVCQQGTCAPGFSGHFCNETVRYCGPIEMAVHCHLHAHCVTQGGFARCRCLDGFEGNGFSCTPSNPCSHPDRGGCSENAECVPGARGTHNCTCHKGWSGDGHVCVAINECELDTRGGCHADALCSYVGPGQSRCTCKPGFAGDGYQCSPIDPCRAGNGGCHDLATCRAVGGGQRVCTCPPGFGGDGLSCYGDIFQELEANAHLSVFYEWFKSAGITLPADRQVTALVPSEAAVRRLSPEDQAFWLQPRMLPNLGALSEKELAQLHGQEVATLDPSTHWEIRNIRSICAHLWLSSAAAFQRVWVQNASVDVADLLATNGVLHIISQILLPPQGDVPGVLGLLQQLGLVPAFSLFRDLLQIEAATAYTIFVPTNHSLEAQGNSSSLDADTVRHHVILGEALSMEALGKGGHRNSLLGPAHWIVFYNHSGQLGASNLCSGEPPGPGVPPDLMPCLPEVNHVPLEGPMLEAPGRSLIGLSGVLTVGSSRCLHSHAEALREKCVNCTRKFRCTQGYQLQDTPRKSCVYRSGFSFARGCSYTCAKKIQVPDCCPGFFGMLCEPCPGGLGGVCSGHGQCQDRFLGSGECRCHEGFHGTACEMCELGRYGPNCTGVCDCAHGLCQEGLQGDGSCVCNVGWQGLRCDQSEWVPMGRGQVATEEAVPDQSHPAPQKSPALSALRSATPMPKVDPCAHGHGGCSPHANCTKVAPGQRTCTCQDGYVGDGELCQEINSCLIHHGGCHIHAECIPTGPQQVSMAGVDMRAMPYPHRGAGQLLAPSSPTDGNWGQVSCSCLEGYSGDGIQTCDLLDPCSKNNGGCSPYATCKSTGDGQRTCTCDTAHTVGDGLTCRTRVGLVMMPKSDPDLEYKELKGDGPFTIFVPHAYLMSNLSQDELARIRVHRQLVFRYHVIGCRRLRSEDLLELGYATALSGHPLRFSEREVSPGPGLPCPAPLRPPTALHACAWPRQARGHLRERELSPDRDPTHDLCLAHYRGPVQSRALGPPAASEHPTHRLHQPHARPQGSIYLNDFARVVSSDHEAVNGILHFIDRVLLPPEALHWESGDAPVLRRNVTAAAQSFGYKIVSSLLKVLMAGLLPLLRDPSHRPFTMLWPTDAALQALPLERQAWLYHEDHRDKLAAILRGHIIRSVEGELMVGEDDARIVQRHLPFEGGLAYGIDQLLEPPGLGARCDRFETWALKVVREARGRRAGGHPACGVHPPDFAVLASLPSRTLAASVGWSHPVLRGHRSR